MKEPNMIRTGIRLERQVWEQFSEACELLNLVKTRTLSDLMEEWLHDNRHQIEEVRKRKELRG